MATIQPKYYLGDFQMGTVSCPLCGFLFPLTTDHNTKSSTCRRCKLHCAPNPTSEAELLRFAEGDLLFAVDLIREKVAAEGPSQASQAGKDNRVIEEAFCERCNTHRPCKTFARQTRGADEGQTIFYCCTVCKSEWSHNS